MNKSRRQTESFTKTIGKSITRVALFGTAMGGAAVAGTALLVRRQLEAVDASAKLADTLGFTTEQLAGYEHAAGLAGIGNEEFAKGAQRLQKNISDAANGLSTSKRAFEALGLSYEALDKLSPDEQIKAVADALPGLASQAQRTQVAQDLFGRSGLKMVNLLAQGSDAIARQQEEAKALGLTYSRLDAAKIESANDAVTRLGSAFTGVFRTLAVKVAPAISRVTTFFVEKWIEVRTKVMETVQSIAMGIFRSLKTISSFYAPYISQLYKTTVAVMQAIGKAVGTAFGFIADMLHLAGVNFESFGDLALKVRDTVVAGLAAIEFGFMNFSRLAEFAVVSAAAKLVEFGGIVQHAFTVALPKYVEFFADNAYEILLTFGANTLTFMENLVGNIVDVIKSIPDLIAGNVNLADVWKPLSDGFVNVIGELPEIPARQMGELEKILKDDAARLGTEIGTDFSEHLAKRMGDISTSSGASDRLFSRLAGLFSGDGFSIPDLSLNDESLDALNGFGGKDMNVAAIERGTVEAYRAERGRREQQLIEKNTRESARQSKATSVGIRDLINLYRDNARDPQEIVSIL